MRETDEYARNAVRVWLRQVMENKNWSAREWALAANTSPTNITRLLDPLNKTAPSIETVAKLARIARSQPNLVTGGTLEETAAPAEPPFNFCPDCGYDLRAITPQPRDGRRRQAP